MSRGLTAAVETLISDEVVRPFYMAFFDFPGSPTRVTSLGSNVNWDSETWYSLGTLGSVDIPEETSNLQANPCVFTLSGIPTDLIAESLDGDYKGEVCELYLGFLDSGGSVEADPYLIFSGLMNYIELDKGPETSSLSLYGDGNEVRLRNARNERYTDEDQQNRYLGDKFFEFSPFTAQSVLHWGRHDLSNNIPKHNGNP
jgi:hypothetical protein